MTLNNRHRGSIHFHLTSSMYDLKSFCTLVSLLRITGLTSLRPSIPYFYYIRHSDTRYAGRGAKGEIIDVEISSSRSETSCSHLVHGVGCPTLMGIGGFFLLSLLLYGFRTPLPKACHLWPL